LRCCGLLSARGLPFLRGAGSRLADEFGTAAVFRREGDPYNIVLVDLEEGFRMLSRVAGVSAENVEIGMRVRLEMDYEGDEPVPVFVPEGEDR
jgi:uncharacterized OB-fold protein